MVSCKLTTTIQHYLFFGTLRATGILRQAQLYQPRGVVFFGTPSGAEKGGRCRGIDCRQVNYKVVILPNVNKLL